MMPPPLTNPEEFIKRIKNGAKTMMEIDPRYCQWRIANDMGLILLRIFNKRKFKQRCKELFGRELF